MKFIPDTLCAHKFDMHILITINGSLPQLVPKGIIRPVVSVSALAWFIELFIVELCISNIM